MKRLVNVLLVGVILFGSAVAVVKLAWHGEEFWDPATLAMAALILLELERRS